MIVQMLNEHDHTSMFGLHSRTIAQYLEELTVSYINDLLDLIYDFILPLLHILYNNPEDTPSRKHPRLQ